MAKYDYHKYLNGDSIKAALNLAIPSTQITVTTNREEISVDFGAYTLTISEQTFLDNLLNGYGGFKKKA